MSHSASGNTLNKTILCLVLTLVLGGLAFLATACQDLSPDTTTTVITTTSTEMSIESTTVTDAGDTSSGEPSGEAEGGTEPGSGGDAGSDDDDDTLAPIGPIATAFFFTTTTERTLWSFTNADDGDHVTVRVGDFLNVRLDFSPEDEVAEVTGSSTSPAVLMYRPGWIYIEPGADVVSWIACGFEALSPGTVGVTFLARHEDGSLYDMWQLFVEVTE